MRPARAGGALAIACVAVLSACGGAPSRAAVATPDGREGRPTPRDQRIGDAARAQDDADSAIGLDALAARGATEAPLMREAMRVAAVSPRSSEVRADKDLCVRALLGSSAPVRAWFADESGTPRGETMIGAGTGTVPPRGPACMKKGEALHLVVESADGSSASARAVIFAAP